MTRWQGELDSDDLVVAFEASPYSDAALEFAKELAERTGAALHVVHVTDLEDYPSDPDLAGSEAGDDITRNSLAHVRAEVERAMSSFSGEWTYSSEKGNAAKSINETAERYHVFAIVLGSSTPGVGGMLHRILKGSVLKKMTRASGRVVMVVPKHPPGDGVGGHESRTPD